MADLKLNPLRQLQVTETACLLRVVTNAKGKDDWVKAAPEGLIVLDGQSSRKLSRDQYETGKENVGGASGGDPAGSIMLAMMSGSEETELPESIR